jgi:threonine dehydrogenase-like Zn-dependent dehydrogenase
MQRVETNLQDDQLTLTNAESPKIGPGEVMVEISASYVAPFVTDLVPPNTAFVTPQRPFAPGLDAIGKIVELGPDGSDLAVGDMVYVDCLIEDNWDGHEGEAAFAGNFAVSAKAERLLAHWRHGTFASHIHMPVANVTPVGPALEHAPTEALCRLGWLGTALAAYRKGGFQPGMHVAVIGASGQVGSSAILIGLALGAGHLTAVGRDPARLAPLAKLDPRVSVSTEVPLGCDLVISTSEGDCAPMIEAAMARLRRRGALVFVASPTAPPRAAGMVLREITLAGSFWFPPELPAELVDMIAKGTLDLSVLTPHAYPLAEVNAALQAARSMPPLHHVTLLP